MTTGLVVLAVALVAAAGIGLLRARTNGRFRVVKNHRSTGDSQGLTGTATPDNPGESPADRRFTAWDHLAESLPDEELGERATLVQFSSAFCAPCRTTRVVLADVAGRADGVRHVEVDAEQHLDVVRALDVRRTPTTLVLDSSGRELLRAAGAPTRDQVLAALPEPAR